MGNLKLSMLQIRILQGQCFLSQMHTCSKLQAMISKIPLVLGLSKTKPTDSYVLMLKWQ